MIKVFLVIGDAGDGSTFRSWYFNIDKLVELNDSGELPDQYQSGDGLQVDEFEFPDGFDFSQIKGMDIEDEWGNDYEDFYC